MKTTNKEQKDYYELVGRTVSGRIYMLDYTFKYSDNFSGATGTHWEAVTKEEYEERLNIDTFMEEFRWLWEDQVKNNRTDESLKEWSEAMLEEGVEDLLFDKSYENKWEDIRKAFPEYNKEDYPVFSCTGGGRCFPIKEEWEILINPELLKAIDEAEE